MAITYESESTASSLTINVPSGTADGDLLVAIMGDGGAELTAPVGWTTVDSYRHYPSGNDWVWFGYIIVSGSPPTSYTWTGGGTNTRGVIQRFSGVAAYGGAAAQSNTNSTILTCPSVTPSQDGSLIVFCGGGFVSGTPTTPLGYSNSYATSSLSNSPELLIASKVQVTAASTGSVDSSGWRSYSNLDQRGVHMWFTQSGGGGSSNGAASYYYRQQGLVI